jgi:hypothetical protein
VATARIQLQSDKHRHREDSHARDGQRYLPAYHGGRDGQRPDHPGDPQDQREVEDVGADQVADREAAVALSRGQAGDQELGGAGAHAHHDDADDDGGHAQPGGDPAGPDDELVGGQGEYGQSGDAQQDG